MQRVYQYFLFEFAVAIAALFLDRMSGVWATVLSVFLTVFVFIDPSGASPANNTSALLLFVVVCLLLVAAAESVHRLAERFRLAHAHNDTLYRELSHRTANQLQLISATVALQTARATDPDTRESLMAINERLTSIARVDRLLNSGGAHDQVDADDYMRQLCEMLGASVIGPRPITLSCQAEPARVSRDMAELVGIAVNELVINAVKHAFTDAASGRIAVFLARAGDSLRLTVEDNGKGCPSDARSGSGWSSWDRCSASTAAA